MRKTMKKIIATVLTAAMAMSVGMPAFAETEFETSIPQTVMSYLTDENGNVTPIEGRLVDSPMAYSDNGYVGTYEFLLPTRAVSHQSSATDTDNSISVRATTTIYYQTQNQPTEYKLTAVGGSWTILDNSVSVTRADLTYVCRGIVAGSGQFRSLSNISNNFYYATGFNTFVPSAGPGVVGGTLKLNLSHGSNPYSWELENYAYDSM